MGTSNFEDLNIWKEAHRFVLNVYKLTKCFPKDEIFGLTSQFRRAAISVPANIAEGFRKKGISDKLRFYNIAQGSSDECRYYVILSHDLEYISQNEFDEMYEQINLVSRLLNAYCSGIIKNQQNSKT